MIQTELLKMLVCPEDHSPLEPASSDLVARVNRAIAAGRAVNRVGRTLEKPIDAALVRADRRVLYAIVDDIPMMLVDEAIPLDQPSLGS